MPSRWRALVALGPGPRTLAGSILAAVLVGSLATACASPAAPSAPKTTETKGADAKPAESGAAAQNTPSLTLKVPDSIPAPAAPKAAAPAAASPAAASPAAATKAAAPAASPQAPSPVAARTAPKGQVAWAWQTALSPAWLDPQEYPAGSFTPFVFAYILHDAVVKHLPGEPYAPSLAESYEIASDSKSATFKLRPNITFHDGTPVTSEDVKWSYENYRGGNAKALKDKTERVETPDARTVRFVFKEPFFDFLVYYGGAGSAASFVLPSKYYQQVGPDGFKQKPIGAGPFKLSAQKPDTFEFEAFTDYWRKSPAVKTLIVRGVPEGSTRVAMIQTGEVDFSTVLPGQLWEVITKNPQLTQTPTRASAIFIEMIGWDKPESPFSKKQVREAVSLALDRKAISAAEEAGLSGFTGNWIPEDWPGAIKAPMPEYNPARAKQLLAEAGYANGIDVPQITAVTIYSSMIERMMAQLREVGIRVGRPNLMERAAFNVKIGEGPGSLDGMLLNVFAAPGDSGSWIRAFATCQGSSSRTCTPDIDEPFRRSTQATTAEERDRILQEIQRFMIDNYVFVQVFRQALLNAQGPRIANQPDEIWNAIPGHPLMAPVEDIQVKD